MLDLEQAKNSDLAKFLYPYRVGEVHKKQLKFPAVEIMAKDKGLEESGAKALAKVEKASKGTSTDDMEMPGNK